MLGLGDIRQTRVYQEALLEGLQEGLQEGERRGKLRTVPILVATGLSINQIAEALGFSVEEVREAAQEESSN